MTLNCGFAFDDLFFGEVLVERVLLQPDAVKDAPVAVKGCQEDGEQKERRENPLVEALAKELDFDERTHDLEERALFHT